MTETRVTADGMRRRRVCTVCKRRFTTYEKVGAPALKVQKRDGSLEPFDGDSGPQRLYVDNGEDHVTAATEAYRDARVYEWLLSKQL